MTPRTTVVIPTYNRSSLLREAIASVLGQTCTDFEILISDNASTDNVADVVASFDDRRIHYHRHEHNVGMGANYRFVLTEPETEFIAYLSDDDLYTPNLLETAVQALDAYPAAAYFASPASYYGKISSGQLRPRAITDTTTPLMFLPPEQMVHFLGSDNPGPMSVIRKAVINDSLQWPPLDYQPIDLFMLPQFMLQGGFIFSNTPLYQFRVHEDNVSLNPNALVQRLRFNLMVWYGIRWIAQYLLAKGNCTIEDILSHGLTSPSEQHIVPLVVALASFDSPPALRTVARKIFDQRKDMDQWSSRFRLARRLGFWTLPLSEKVSQLRTRWRPYASLI
ncbi:MAG TPA: glycosyltransferase family 2 protein [Anaerolineae bacterium]|jgi:glycosyltransferase involved in cell wall biosynthesis